MEISMTSYEDYSLYYNKNIFTVTDYIKIRQPSNGEILEYGEDKFFASVQRLCYTPSDMKSELYESGIVWTDMEDFDLFCVLCKSFRNDDYKLLFETPIDFKSLVLFKNDQTNLNFLAYQDNTGQPILDDVVIDLLVYSKIVDYFRKIYGLKRSHDVPANNYTMRYMVEEDKRKKKKYTDKPPKFESIIMPIIITVCNTNEFKYNSEQALELGFYKLLTDFSQIQKSKSALALLQGSYSGMIDTSKIDPKNFNWMYEATKK